MNLLQSISEEVASYDKFLENVVQTVDRFEVEIITEKRLGLSIQEAGEYFQYQKGDQANTNPNDVVQFKSPGPVAQPVQDPRANRPAAQRIHLVFDPSTNKISDVIKSDIRSNPGSQFAQANQEQLAAAVTHMEGLKPEIAQKIRDGSIAVWVPQTAKQNSGSRMLGMVNPAPMTRDNNVRDMSADQLVNTMKSTSNWKTV